MTSSQTSIIVCGGGLAGNLAALSLVKSLGANFRIVQIVDPSSPPEDFFYGGATAPESYNFLQALGLDEATLLQKTNTSFSYGTRFGTWLSKRPFMLCHHAPFPTPVGIPLHHFLTRSNAALEPLLISAMAARQDRFAHPPEDARNPLSRAEYGYQFAPEAWVALLESLISTSQVRRTQARIAEVECGNGFVTAILTTTGERLAGDFFVDATGAGRQCIEALGGRYSGKRSVSAHLATEATAQLGPPCRIIEASETGWASTTHLQDGDTVLSLGGATKGYGPEGSRQIALGHLEQAWVGNCVAIGHAAWAIEPLTPAPMMLLHRDIERLLELVPAGPDMATERREYNRRFEADVLHATCFQNALYSSTTTPSTPFWTAAVSAAGSCALTRKIAQFENRGLLVSFDLEPFNGEDWIQNHWGMGRLPRQYDRQLDSVPREQADDTLARMKGAIDQMLVKMPPHHLYVARLKDYLTRQGHG